MRTSPYLCHVPGFSCLQMQADIVPGLSLSSLPFPAALDGPSVLPRAWCLPRSMRLADAARSFQGQGHACLRHSDECKNLFLLGLTSFPEESRLIYLGLSISSPKTQSSQYYVRGCRWWQGGCSQKTTNREHHSHEASGRQVCPSFLV